MYLLLETVRKKQDNQITETFVSNEDVLLLFIRGHDSFRFLKELCLQILVGRYVIYRHRISSFSFKNKRVILKMNLSTSQRNKTRHSYPVRCLGYKRVLDGCFLVLG